MNLKDFKHKLAMLDDIDEDLQKALAGFFDQHVMGKPREEARLAVLSLSLHAQRLQAMYFVLEENEPTSRVPELAQEFFEQVVLPTLVVDETFAKRNAAEAAEDEVLH